MDTRTTSRDQDGLETLVTGLGFCLPGGDTTSSAPVFTAAELWDVVSNGRCCLTYDGIYHGAVNLTDAMFDERLPETPGLYTAQYSRTHRLGLISFAEACFDAKLDFRAGDLSGAAILTGRGGIDDNVDCYLDLRTAQPDHLSPAEAAALFIRAQIGGTGCDVGLLQSSLARSTGPCFAVSCGCSSSTIQLGNALKMISSGEIDVAVVTGVDTFSPAIMRKGQQLLLAANRGNETGREADLVRLDRLMRPYDVRAGSVNFGEGSATVILESRRHAEQRGAQIYGRLIAQATTRDGLISPLSLEDSGASLVAGVRKCLGDRYTIDQIPYINGGSDGDPNVTVTESNAVRELYGADAPAVLLSSQEACFGHSGAQSGVLGVAQTLLMMQRRMVCPTANCERPADELSFDPIPGTSPRPLEFDHALSFTYQIGGTKSVLLLGSADAA
jgi:3-oxoacyl-[acyl-carrier-protein] synthase II